MDKLSEAGSKYGASMGRSDTTVDTDFPVVFEMVRLEWVDGDYDEGGAYWGHTKNEYIYRAVGESAEAVEEMFIRGKSSSEAKATLLETYANATFAVSADVEVLTSAYLEAALWSSHNDHEDSNDEENFLDSKWDVSEEMRAHFAAQCESFYEQAASLLAEAESAHGYSIDQAGYDFWMTQSGSGVDFTDRDLGKIGDDLKKIAKTFSEDDIYIGDDNLIHSSNEYRTKPSVTAEATPAP